MNNPAPIQEPAGDSWSGTWRNWFAQVFAALPWKQGFTTSGTLDFPSIAGHAQAAIGVSLKGARPGDAVLVTPAADEPGIIFTGTVSAVDTVTVTAKNYTAGSLDPASQSFRLIVLQN